MMAGPRDILEEYVQAGKLMQLATLTADGSPALCHVWYACCFRPDRLCFISRPDRMHSVNICNDGRVAGGIVHISLAGLGQVVRGVTFKGLAVELSATPGDALTRFVQRWPQASKAITLDRPGAGLPASRLYEVRVTEWILFDEENFPNAPRQIVSAVG